MHDPDARFMGLWEECDGYGLDTALAHSFSSEAAHQFKKLHCHQEGLCLETQNLGVCLAWILVEFSDPSYVESPASELGPTALVFCRGGAFLCSSHSSASPQRFIPRSPGLTLVSHEIR